MLECCTFISLGTQIVLACKLTTHISQRFNEQFMLVQCVGGFSARGCTCASLALVGCSPYMVCLHVCVSYVLRFAQRSRWLRLSYDTREHRTRKYFPAINICMYSSPRLEIWTLSGSEVWWPCGCPGWRRVWWACSFWAVHFARL